MKTIGLANHVLDNNIINLSQCIAILQHLPGFIGMEMNLNKILITGCNQTVSFKMLCDVIRNLILVKILIPAINKELSIITVCKLIILRINTMYI